jgi:sugar lactone lactonase YvrE
MVLCTFVTPHDASGQIISTFAGNGLAGYFGDHGAATSALLDSPTCLAADGAGNIYINDQRNNCVRKVSTAGVITTIAGTGLAGYDADNIPATSAKLNSNWGIAIDDTGNLYIADQLNHRVRKVNTAGIISTFAGNGTQGNSGDNGAATAAQLQTPVGIAIDGRGNVYIGDPNSFCVRKVNRLGVITTFAGNGLYGYSGDNGPATAARQNCRM